MLVAIMSHSSCNSNGMTREDLLLRGSDWSLACDNVILNRLKDYSENLVRRSREVTADCDSLLNDVDSLSFKICNVTNQFMMLGNTLFVENSVQEFEECNITDETLVQSDNAVGESKAEKEAALIDKMKESIRIGVGIQRQRDELKANGFEDSYGSVDSRMSSSVNLAHLIGSSKFFSSRYCGLMDESQMRRPSKPESVASSSSNYDKSSSIGQGYPTQLSEPEVPTSPSPVLSDGTNFEPPVPPPMIPQSAEMEPKIEEPKVLSAHDAIRRSLEERLKGMNPEPAPTPREPSKSLLDDELEVPSPPAVDLENSTRSREATNRKVTERESRSPSPVGARPPPIMDLSDSDEDMFAPIDEGAASKNRFDDFFKNQNIYQPVYTPSVYEPPPLTSQPPEPEQTEDTARKVAKHDSPIPDPVSKPPESRPVTKVVQNAAISSETKSETSVPTATPTLTPAPVKAENAASATVIDKLSSQRSAKKVSIFDSSDSDDDLFANFGQKKPPKTDLFASAETPTKPYTTYQSQTRPPPILDVSDDSEDDIFASFKRKQPLFADRMSPPPLPGREQLRESSENANIFSPPILEPPTGKSALSGISETPKRDIFGDSNRIKGRTHSLSEPSEPPALGAVPPTASQYNSAEHVETEAVEVRDEILNNDSFHSESKEPRDQDLVSENENEYFKKETIFPEEKLVTPEHISRRSSSSGGSDIFESKPYVSPQVDMEDTSNPKFSARSIGADELLQQKSNIISAPPDDLFQRENSRPGTVDTLYEPVPTEKISVPPKEDVVSKRVKSIFESSDSDDDLFSGGTRRTKTTPTLGYTSPLPPREPPTLPQEKEKQDAAKDRAPARIQLSDSDEDIFKSLGKTSHVDLPKPVKVSSPVASPKELLYPINQGKSAQIFDSEDSLPLPKPNIPPSKSKQPPVATSIFDSSDSDDDLFSPISKAKAAPSLKNLVQRNTTAARPSDVTSKRSVSLFGDSDDGEEHDDLFSNASKPKKAATQAPTPSSKSIVADDDHKSEQPELEQTSSVEKSQDFATRQRQKLSRHDPESKERLFGAVAKNLESILSAKVANSNASVEGRSVSLSSPVAETSNASSFDSSASADNLLRCVTKDRPKIHHHRRPPSLVVRRQFSRNALGSMFPNDEELGPFV